MSVEEKKISKYETSCSANGFIFKYFIMKSLSDFGGRANRQRVLSPTTPLS